MNILIGIRPDRPSLVSTKGVLNATEPVIINSVHCANLILTKYFVILHT